MALFNTSRHRRSHSQCAMSLDEIVIREIQGNRSLKVFKLFAESIGWSGEPSAVHPQCVILLLDMGSGNAAHIRRALHNGFLSADDFG